MSARNETQFWIGQLAPAEAQRDAIHIAVLPVTCDERLYPGDRVTLVPGSADVVRETADDADPGLGIVDPFLSRRGVRPGERFFVFLLPNTVTGMRHHWSHPAFDSAEPAPAPAPVTPSRAPTPQERREAEEWLRKFADRWGMDYHSMRRAAEDGDDFITAHGRDFHGPENEGGEDADFWHYLQVATGRSFSEAHRQGITWTCSC
jgi:hypothetical protein